MTPSHRVTSYLLDGRKTVITGGDSGIGRAVAVAFAREGADVLLTHLPEGARTGYVLSGSRLGTPAAPGRPTPHPVRPAQDLNPKAKEETPAMRAVALVRTLNSSPAKSIEDFTC